MATITPREILCLPSYIPKPQLDTISLSIARIEGIGMNVDGTAWMQLTSVRNPAYWKHYESIDLDLELLVAE